MKDIYKKEIISASGNFPLIRKIIKKLENDNSVKNWDKVEVMNFAFSCI